MEQVPKTEVKKFSQEADAHTVKKEEVQKELPKPKSKKELPVPEPKQKELPKLEPQPQQTEQHKPEPKKKQQVLETKEAKNLKQETPTTKKEDVKKEFKEDQPSRSKEQLNDTSKLDTELVQQKLQQQASSVNSEIQNALTAVKKPKIRIERPNRIICNLKETSRSPQSISLSWEDKRTLKTPYIILKRKSNENEFEAAPSYNGCDQYCSIAGLCPDTEYCFMLKVKGLDLSLCYYVKTLPAPKEISNPTMSLDAVIKRLKDRIVFCNECLPLVDVLATLNTDRTK